MNVQPLDKLTCGWQGHKSALWWLFLLYRDPEEFRKTTKGLEKLQAFFVGLKLCLHFLPWAILIVVVGRFLLFESFDVPLDDDTLSDNPEWLSHLYNIILGITSMIAFGMIVGMGSQAIDKGFLLGFGLGIPIVIMGGISEEMLGSFTGAIIMGIIWGCCLGITISSGIDQKDSDDYESFWELIGKIVKVLIPVLASAAIFSLGFWVAGGKINLEAIGNSKTFENAAYYFIGITSLMFMFLIMLLTSVRVYYYPLHITCLLLQRFNNLYLYHPIAWDKLCHIPFVGVEKLLVNFAYQFPKRANAEIERLIQTYPSQRYAALKAKTILLARQAAASPVQEAPNILAALPQGEKGYLKQTKEIQRLVSQITHLRTRVDEVNRPFLKEPLATLLVQEIINFKGIIGGFKEPLLSEFSKAAHNWLVAALSQREKARKIIAKEPVSQVFRAGDPVNQEQEAFVPRLEVGGEIEQQLMLSTGCPGLVLYGRRRVGKSTIVRNLHGFLPSEVKTASLSMQEAKAFTSAAYFYSEINKRIADSGIGFFANETRIDTLPQLQSNLQVANHILLQNKQRLLLIIDEYEKIDGLIGNGTFPAELLDCIREAIQSLRNITWVFCGSHEISELTNAPWTSQLISARTIEVPFFTREETHSLLTNPMQHARIFKEQKKEPPIFSAAFWGENGIERIFAQTAGWPVFVQLVAEQLVDLVNNSNKAHVTEPLFERALDKCTERGHNVFYELLRGESLLPGEWDYLKNFRQKEVQALPPEEALYQSLRRRKVVVEENGEWRLRVPLMARWLRERG